MTGPPDFTTVLPGINFGYSSTRPGAGSPCQHMLQHTLDLVRHDSCVTAAHAPPGSPLIMKRLRRLPASLGSSDHSPKLSRALLS